MFSALLLFVSTASMYAAKAMHLPESRYGTPQSHDVLDRRAAVSSYYLACYADNQNYRSLANDAFAADDMTVEKCEAYCSSRSSEYEIFGVEYGRECYCGSGLRNGPVDSGRCNTPCAGNTAETCGGGNALSVYTTSYQLAVSVFATPNVAQLGCFRDFYGSPTNYRVLKGANYQSDTMTMESCASFCTDRGYAYGGVEYGRECYCDSVVPTETSTACDVPCAGNANEICGGGNALNIFQNKFYAPSVSSSSQASSSVSSPTSTSEASSSGMSSSTSSSLSSSISAESSSSPTSASSTSSAVSSSSSSAPAATQTSYTLNRLYNGGTLIVVEITYDSSISCANTAGDAPVYGYGITSVSGQIFYQDDATGLTHQVQLSLSTGTIPINQYSGEVPDQCFYPDLPRYPFTKNGVALTPNTGPATFIYLYAQTSQANDDIYGIEPSTAVPTTYDQVFFDYSTSAIL